MRFILGTLLLAAVACRCDAQTLHEQLQSIADASQGKLRVACALPGTALDCTLDPHAQPPMQSVFKLPLGLYVLHLVEQGKLSLDQRVAFTKTDLFNPKEYSPLQDTHPDAGVDVPLRELLGLTVTLSDNAAADILLRISGGPAATNEYIASLGVHGFMLRDSEHSMQSALQVQYRDWFEPAGAVEFLRILADRPPLTPEHMALLLGWMRPAPGRPVRLGVALPAGTVIEHKTGTSGTAAGLSPATNDIGLVTLPDGRKLAVAIFLTDSRLPDDGRDAVIGKAAAAIYQAAIHAGQAR